jgi:hypothetical protein
VTNIDLDIYKRENEINIAIKITKISPKVYMKFSLKSSIDLLKN